MKSAIFLIVVVVSVAVLQSSFAQSYQFKVLVNKGKNEVRSGATWQPVKAGTSLMANDELKVSENSYVALVHVSGQPLEVKQPGKYTVAKLSAELKNSPTVMKKYTDFILSSNEAKKSNLTATGAVHRGPAGIELYLPGKAGNPTVFNPVVLLGWNTENLNGPYQVVITTFFDDELATYSTDENFVQINLDAPEFQNETNLKVKVISKTDRKDSGDEFALKRTSGKESQRVKGLLSEFTSSPLEETALNSYLLAGFYEKNNLLVDTSSAYLRAINLAPDVQEYRDAYTQFLLRTGLKAPKPGK